VKFISRQRVIGVCCEGVNLGRLGKLCWLVVSTILSPLFLLVMVCFYFIGVLHMMPVILSESTVAGGSQDNIYICRPLTKHQHGWILAKFSLCVFKNQDGVEVHDWMFKLDQITRLYYMLYTDWTMHTLWLVKNLCFIKVWNIKSVFYCFGHAKSLWS